ALPTASIAIAHPRSRHRERRRPGACRQRPLSLPVAVARSLRPHTLRVRRAQRGLELLLDELLDRLPDSLPPPLLHRVRSHPRRFFVPPNPAIASHGVIPRPPLPGGCELWINSPENDAFSLFHQHETLPPC